MFLIKKKSIKYKLFIQEISLALVAMTLFFTVSSAYFIMKARDDVYKNMQYSSSITASNVYNLINNMENCLDYVSSDSTIQNLLSLKQMPPIVEMMKNYDYIRTNFILIRSNYNFPIQITIYSSNEDTMVFDSSITDRVSKIKNTLWYKSIVKNPSRFFFFTEKDDEKLKFCIVNTIYNSNNYNDVAGYIKVSTDIDTFKKILKDGCIADSNSILINNKKGNIICSTQDENTYEKYSKELLKSSETTLKTFNIENERFYSLKKDTEQDIFSIIILKSNSSVYKTIHQMFLLLLVILLIIFSTSVAVAYLLGNSVISSLDIIADAMKKSKFGELKKIENIGNQNSEILEVVDAYNHMVTSINDLVAYNNTYQESLKKYEFNFLQMQIKPHFLYNTLDIIQYLAKERKTEDVTYLIKNLSRFYKISLHNKSDFVTIENEIKHILYYVAIENFKHDNCITLDIDIDEDIQQLCIPKITFQPLIENSINHGILEKDNPVGKICITAEKNNDDIYIYIVDDGVGISKQKIDEIMSGKTHSFGVVNTDKRLKLFFGNNYGLNIESEEGIYTKITIKIKGVSLNDKNIDC